jgi:hypothetical protein
MPGLRRALRPVAAVVVGLAVLGAILGVVWAWWSPPVPAGVNLPGGLERQESKSFISADVRFIVLVALVGVVAAIGAWLMRSARGPWMAVGLTVGGLLGAWLTGAVGNAVGGGTDDAPVNHLIRHLELHMQITGGYFFEAAIAVLVYSLLVAFAADDDLGRPDPLRAAAHERRATPPPGPGSVPPQGGVQDAWRYGDGSGSAQQHDFPTQQPH